jgi:SAM-dependent methyltransferase
MMEFTGERYVPGYQGLEEIFVEHMSRYVFASGIARGRMVLDLGCGCGYGTHLLALAGAAHVLGIDSSDEAIEYARSTYRHPNLAFTVMDAHELGLPRTMELVTCFEMIEHVKDAPRMLGEVARILQETGILIISTPNKATYVAGGEGGKNPFHVREFDKDEFTRLLRSEFSSVLVFGQFWTEGMALSPHPPSHLSDSVPGAGLPGEDGTIERRQPPGEPPYFVAVCGSREATEKASTKMATAVTHSLETRYDRLKIAMKVLEHEFDKRGRWALQLDHEIHEKNDTIKLLQAELEALRCEFDERGLWARGLDGKVRQLEARISELKGDNARLRHALTAAGQRP